jgi:hypothetical protein
MARNSWDVLGTMRRGRERGPVTQTLEVGRPDAPLITDRRRSERARRQLRAIDGAVLLGLLAALSISFFYGWFFDGTHPIGGKGWADQTLYTHVAIRLRNGHLPTAADLHFAPGYSMLGALGTFASRFDPFWIVSYGLLIGSAIFLYRGSRAVFSPFWSALFLVSLFVWDLHTRTFSTASELFTVPWNNQPLFFAFAFFFWLYARARTASLNLPRLIGIGAIVGWLAITREESVLFCVGLAVIYLVARRAPLKAWLCSAATAVVVALPGLLMKQHALGSIFKVGATRPGNSYSGQADRYFSIHHLVRNLLDVVINSNFARVAPGRDALLQSEPWLWLGIGGAVIVFVSKRYDRLMKAFFAVSLLLMAFYLSGDNVSAAKLKLHCIRYLTPGLIALHFGVIVVLAETWRRLRAHERTGG